MRKIEPPTEETRKLLAFIANPANFRKEGSMKDSVNYEEITKHFGHDVDAEPDSPLNILLEGGWIEEPFLGVFRVI